MRVGGIEYGYDAAQLEFTFGSILSGKLSANRFFEIVGSVIPCIRKSWDSLSQLGFESVLSDASHYSYNPLATTAQLLDWVSIEA